MNNYESLKAECGRLAAERDELIEALRRLSAEFDKGLHGNTDGFVAAHALLHRLGRLFA